MSAEANVVTAARRYIESGWNIVAVAGKRPIEDDWRNRPMTLANYQAQLAHPGVTGIGFLGGAPNKNIVPIDFDTSAAYLWFVDECLKVGLEAKSFPTHRSKKGRHVFVHDVRGTLGNTRGALPADIDIRGNGQVLLPPSRHVAGGYYTAENSLLRYVGLPPACPDFVYELIEKPKHTAANGSSHKPASSSENKYCRRALDYERANLAKLPKGRRNEELNNAALKLGSLAHYGAFAEDETRAAMRSACEANGLIAEDGLSAFDATFDSGWEAGLAQPREIPAGEPPPRDRRRQAPPPPPPRGEQSERAATDRDFNGGECLLEGAALLDGIHAFLGRFVSYPAEDAHVAHTLWIAHTHLMEAWESTPRLAFLSPEPGSGKTRALEVSELLVPKPVEAVNVTPAYLFRKVGDADGACILFDEIDTVFGPKARDNEEIRGLLNAGHRRGAVAGRCVVRGKTVETEEIPAYCAVALAGLGDLPDTLLSRAVVVRMRRRAPSERVEPYRRRVHASAGHELRDHLTDWASRISTAAADAVPDMPPGIEDRNADVWEPLLAVADLAGGDWPTRARVSCVSLVSLSMVGAPSLGIRLLSDLRTVFADSQALSTGHILETLNAMDEAPWADIKGKPLNPRGLSRRLSKYGISPKQVRTGEWTGKGYAKEDLHDVWQRYLPPVSPLEVRHSVEETGKHFGSLGPPTIESETRETSDTETLTDDEFPPPRG